MKKGKLDKINKIITEQLLEAYKEGLLEGQICELQAQIEISKTQPISNADRERWLKQAEERRKKYERHN